MAESDLVAKGRAAAEALRLDEARAAFEQALEGDAGDVTALVWLARLDAMEGEGSRAVARLDSALEIDPKAAEALALGGFLLLQEGRTEAALESLEAARAADADLRTVHSNLARCYRRLGRVDEAEAAARRALEIDPDHVGSLYELSTILALKAEFTDAILLLVRALELDPAFLEGYLTLGQAYQHAGKGDLVVELYEEGVRHLPLSIPLREELCRLYAVQLDFGSAIVHALEVARLRGAPGDFLRAGTYAIPLGEIDLAETAFKEAVERDPDGWQGHYNLAELYVQADELVEAARAEYEAAIASDGASYKPLNGLGLLLLNQEGRAEDAREYFLRAIEIAPDAPEPVLNLALACAKLGHWSEGEQLARTAAELSHEGDGLHEQAERLAAAIGRARAEQD